MIRQTKKVPALNGERHLTGTRLWERVMQSPAVQQFQMAFALATGLPVTLLPAGEHLGNDGHLKPTGAFCIKGCLGPDSGKWCLRSLEAAERRAVNADTAVRFRCPSGLLKILVPVCVCERHVGSVMVGPFSLDALAAENLRHMTRRLKRFKLENEVGRLRTSWQHTPVIAKDKAKAATDLVHFFARHLAETANQIALSEVHDSSLLREVTHLLDECEDQDVSLDAVAQRVGLSTCYFCKLFKQQTGMTFSEFRVLRRIEKARRLLDDLNLRVSEVAYAAGFGSVPYFNRAFRRHHGCSPSEYRKARATNWDKKKQSEA